MHKYQWAGKQNRPISEWDISICCTVVQNWPKVHHLDAFTHLSEMELLQDSVHCKLKPAHARCIAGTTQESMMPISRHFYPKCKKKTQCVATCEEICSSLPTTISGCDEQNSSESIMAHIWKYSHLDNITFWKPVEHGWQFFPLWSNAAGSALWRWWII